MPEDTDFNSSTTWELWEYVYDDGSTQLSFFNSANENSRSGLDPKAKLLQKFQAITMNEAMQKYYDFMGWGTYKPMED
jgi:hypothetical protein